jgi:hypothetical protein
MSTYTSYYSVVPYRTTITTTLGGFGWPNPVTSFSYSIRTTTVTLAQSSWPGGPPISTYNPNTWSPQPTSTWPQWPPSPSPWNTPSPTQWTPSPTRWSPTPPTWAPSSQWTPSPSKWTPSTSQWSPSQSPSTWTGWNPSPSQWTSITTPKPPPTSSSEWTPPTTSKPAPWHPPLSSGPSWTSIGDPILPTTPPVQQTSVGPQQPVNPSSSAVPDPVAQGPAVCGPGMPKCTGNTYCDPQPLCSIGEDCAGVCLPILAARFDDVRDNLQNQD